MKIQDEVFRYYYNHVPLYMEINHSKSVSSEVIYGKIISWENVFGNDNKSEKLGELKNAYTRI